MPSGDTIVACATARGRSALAVVRVSGPATGALLDRFVSGDPASRGVFERGLSLRDGASTLPIWVARSLAPASYTGEDTAELILPGNPHLIDRTIERLCTLDAVRPAGPGEFTARAYLAGKLSLDQAEGVGAVIAARNAEELAAAKDLLEGRTGAAYHAWADEVTTLLALVEAGIDFTDQEDVVAIAPADLRARLDALLAALDTALGHAAGREAPAETPLIVLAGAPNAGKSTLFNALLGRHRAIAGEERGLTRDVLIEDLDLRAEAPGLGAVRLADLAGLDQALAQRTATDAAAQRMAHSAIAAAAVILWCDPTGAFERAGPPPFTPAPDQRLIRMRTCADLPAAANPGHAGGDLAVCALDGFHLPLLRRAIADAAFGSSRDAAALAPRHRHAMQRLAAAITDARAAAAATTPSDHALTAPEMVAEPLRRAADAAGELVGRISPDDVLGRVFASFCVGK